MQDERLGKPSASSMPRIYHCPGSVQAEREHAEELPSDEAQEGTEIAEALEAMSTEQLDDKAKPVADRLLEMEQRTVSKWLSDIGFTGTPLMHREIRLWIKRRSSGEKLASAKPDAFYIAGDAALLVQHKTGYLPVGHATVNAQVRCESVAIWHEFPAVKRVRAALARYRFTEDFSASDYSLQDLEYAEREVFWHLWRAQQPGAVLQAGEHCRYCRARGSCQSAAAYSLLPSVVVGTAAAEKLGVEVNLEHCLAAVATLTPEQMAFMHGNSQIIAKILEAVKVQMKRLSPEVLQSVGYRLSPEVKQRALPSVHLLWSYIWGSINPLLAGKDVTLEEFQQCLKATIGPLETLLIAKIKQRDGCNQRDAEHKAKKMLEGICTFNTTAPKLLKIST